MTTTQIILTIVGVIILLLTVWWLFGTMRAFAKLKKRARNAYKSLGKTVSDLHRFTDRVTPVLKEHGCDAERLIKAKENAVSAKKAEAKAECDAILRSRLRKLISEISEKTDMSAIENELSDIESEIFKERKKYNSVVREYNCRRSIFPDMIVAQIFRFRMIEFYTADEADAD